tara:strand:- start:804 stop:1319 length:516 start_codon:yes stop_codon:yes gene_type:complete
MSISPTGIASGEAFGSPTVINRRVISPSSILSLEIFGDSIVELLLQSISLQSIPSQDDFGRPLVTGGDVLFIPIAKRQSWNTIAEFLRTVGFKGSNNDVIIDWLRSEGIVDGLYNDLWGRYLLQNGFVDGSLTDKYAAWRGSVGGGYPWILADGSWDDAGIWRDNENWRDS